MYKKVILFLPVLVIVLSLLAPVLLHFDPLNYQLSEKLNSPFSKFFLGTNTLGQSVAQLIFLGCFSSVTIALSVTFISLTVGIFIGWLAGFYGASFERAFIYLADVFQAFPGILLAIALASFVPPGFFSLIAILSFLGWVGYARLVRAQILQIKSFEYIQAAKTMGFGPLRILFKHILPNIFSALMIQATFGIAGVILAESTLSFLGLGLDSQTPSLGRLLDEGVPLLLAYPHLSIFPGLAIMLIILIFHLAGDELKRRWE